MSEQPQEWTPEYVLSILGGNIVTGEVKRLTYKINAARAAEREKHKSLVEAIYRLFALIDAKHYERGKKIRDAALTP